MAPSKRLADCTHVNLVGHPDLIGVLRDISYTPLSD